jgi:O-antigen ligase
MRAIARTPALNILLIGLILGLEIVVALMANLEYKYAFVIGGGILVIALALIKLQWLAPLQVFSLFVFGISLGGFLFGNIRIFHLVTVFLTLYWVFYVLVWQKERFFLPNPIVLPILLTLGWITLTIMWSPDLQTAIYRWIKVTLVLLGALMFINITKNRSHDHRAIWYWVFSGVLGGVVSYYAWLTMGETLYETWFAHQNVLSAMMNACAFLSLGMAILTRRRLYRWASILTLIFALGMNLNTGCRGGLLSLMAGAIVFVILGIFNSKIGRKFPISLTTLFLIGVALFGIALSRMESLVLFASGRSFDVLNPMASDTFVWRLETFRIALDLLNENLAWVWGMGVGAWEHLQEYYVKNPWGTFIHNYYINFFFQYGLIGMVLMVWLFVAVFSQIVRGYRWFADFRTRWFLNCLVAMYVTLAVHGLVSIEEANAYIWILFATTSVFVDYLKKQHELGLPSNSKI